MEGVSMLRELRGLQLRRLQKQRRSLRVKILSEIWLGDGELPQ